MKTYWPALAITVLGLLCLIFDVANNHDLRSLTVGGWIFVAISFSWSYCKVHSHVSHLATFLKSTPSGEVAESGK